MSIVTMEHRTFTVRAVAPDAPPDAPEARTFTGLAVPWDTPTAYGATGREQIARGAFGEIELPIPLYAQHAHLTGGLPVGAVTAARDTDAGLVIDAYISTTPSGDEVYQLLRDRALSKLSIGFEPITNEYREAEDLVVRTAARLWEVSVVGIPAYEDTTVTEVRAAAHSGPAAGTGQPGRNDMPDTATAAPETRAAAPTTPAVVDVEARERLDDIERRVAAVTLNTGAAGGSDGGYRSAGEALKALARGEQAARDVFTRAYTGATTTDTHMQTGWVERAIALVDRGRPIISWFDTEPLPEDGLTLTYPKAGTITDGTGKQAAQGDDLGYYELPTTTGTANVETYGNYAQITRQVIDRAPTSYLDALFRAQVIAYAKATEAAARTALSDAAGTNTQAMGSTLAASTVPLWLSAVIDGAAAIDTNSLGLVAEALIVSTDVYKKLATFLDTAGRPIFGFSGGGEAVNAAGAGFGVVRRGGQVGDLPLIVNTQLAAGTALIVAPGAMVTYESAGAPVRLDDDNIVNLSTSYAVYGYLASAIVDAKGITKITFS